MPEQSSFVSKIKEILQYALILVVGLGIGLGAKQAWTWYNTPPAFIETNTAPHFANVEQKVVIYSASWCNFCKATRKYLEDNNIPYIDRDIGIGDERTDKLYATIGAKAIPQVVIGNKIISGFNKSLITQELKAQQLL